MSKIYIIAEAGVNHNGDINIAKRLVDAAVDAGADAVKFQTFKAQNLVCKNAGKAAYQLETTEQAETQYEILPAQVLRRTIRHNRERRRAEPRNIGHPAMKRR